MQRLKVNVPVDSVQIMSEEIDHGRIAPRLYLFTGLDEGLPESMMEAIETSETEFDEEYRDDDYQVPAYFIRDIMEMEGENQDSVTVLFSRSHNDFDNPEQPDMLANGRFVNYLIGVELTKAQLALLRALFRGDDGAGLRIVGGVWDGSAVADWDAGHFPLINVTFPPESFTDTWTRLTHKLMYISEGFYADGDNALATGQHYVLRTVQSDLLRAMSELASGSIEDGWNPLVGSEKYLAGESKGQDDKTVTLAGLEGDYADFLVDRILNAYYATLEDSSKWRETEYGTNDLETDSLFAQIMNFNELQETLEEVDASDPYYVFSSNSDPDESFYLDPLRHVGDFPEAFQKVLDHIAETLPDVLELARWDFSREPVLERAYREHGAFKTHLAMILVTTAAVVLLSAREDGIHTLNTFVHLLSVDGDPYPWEMTAFTNQLFNYQTEGFADLLSISAPEGGNDDDDEEGDATMRSYYLIPAMLQISHQVAAEGWTVSNVDERLTHVAHFADMPKVRSLLICLADLDENDPDPIMQAQNALHSYPKEYLVNTVPYLVTSLAEHAAAANALEVGSQEWRDVRYQYVSQTVTGMSFRLRRLSRFTDITGE